MQNDLEGGFVMALEDHSQSHSNWKSGERGDFKNRESWNSVPDLEEKVFQSRNLSRDQDESLSNHGDVNTTVWR